MLPVANLLDLPQHLKRSQSYQFVIRKISGATDELTVLCCLLPPGAAVTDSVLVDAEVLASTYCIRLNITGVLNSMPFNWIARQYVRANLNLFILHILPLPRNLIYHTFPVHLALRLSCNSASYAPLWGTQVGDTWREPNPPFTWPVLTSDDDRWQVRAAIDAVVAEAYGLSRDQYTHVLSTFSHKSYRQAPTLCLAKFDELKQIGLDAFTKKYDPYWDIPLNESLPKPVIELPIPAGEGERNLFGDGEGGSGSAPRRRSTRKR
jgi:hypothetical protein